MLGASGAIYGLLMAIGMLFPNTEFMLLFPPIPLKAKYLALGLGLIALFSGLTNAPGDNVAHFAHLGGMLFAFILLKIWQGKRGTFY
jgi:membrane associated rhomboid family serine protease